MSDDLEGADIWGDSSAPNNANENNAANADASNAAVDQDDELDDDTRQSLCQKEYFQLCN